MLDTGVGVQNVQAPSNISLIRLPDRGLQVVTRGETSCMEGTTTVSSSMC